jgi:hypothetical protein
MQTEDTLAKANQLMSTLAPIDQMDALTLDEAGTCVLSFDEWVVHFGLDAEAATLVLSCVLAPLPAAADAAMLQRLLQANAVRAETGGAVLALDASGERVLWLARASLALEGQAFAALVEAYLNQAEAWAELIDAGLASPQADAVPSDLHFQFQRV